MPLPIAIVLAGIALATGAYGVKKGIDAALDTSDANDLNQKAENIVKKSKENFERAREASQKALEGLGSKKILICDKTIPQFIEITDKFKNVELEEFQGLNELSKFRIDKHSIIELKELSMMAHSMITGVIGGGIAGAATAFGAFGATSALATASTGTAIATLSGAAATNATLAFLGGGSLAAGGLGMAGGAAVLGGIVAGPALAIIGAFLSSAASANLDNAKSNIAEAKNYSKEIELLVTACDGISARSNLFYRILIRLDVIMRQSIRTVLSVLEQEGDDYRNYTDNSKKSVAALYATAQALKAMLDTPILTKDGNLTIESEEVAIKVQDTFLA